MKIQLIITDVDIELMKKGRNLCCIEKRVKGEPVAIYMKYKKEIDEN